MRVLISGVTGQVGRELLRSAPHGFKVQGFNSAALDIACLAEVSRVVEDSQPELIINAAAYTAVDKAESEQQHAYAVNSEGVANLAELANQLEIPMLHISTDYVFAGDTDRPYREGDPTGPNSVYGASKLEGEYLLAAKCSRHIILRTSWVFGSHGNNFVKTMLRLGREREELTVVADQQGCPTSAASIARALWVMALRYRDRRTLPWGLYHFCGTPASNWHEFAREIFQRAHVLGLLSSIPRLQAITTAEYPTPASRPVWSVLDCNKIQEGFGIEQPSWRVALGAVLRELAEDQ